MSTAALKTSLAYWRRQLGIARYWLERARKDATSGAGGATRGVVTAGEGARIKRWKTRVARCEWYIARRTDQLAARGKFKPRIVTSAQLGLRFQYVWGVKGRVYRGAGHYTAGARARDARELAGEMRRDHAQHARQGWGGLSYEAMFADDGTIGLGNPADRKSAAVAMHNTGMVNLCVPGTTGDRMTAACKRSIRWYLDHAHTRAVPRAYRLPRPARELGWRGHREYNPTACPGDLLSDYKEIW